MKLKTTKTFLRIKIGDVEDTKVLVRVMGRKMLSRTMSCCELV